MLERAMQRLEGQAPEEAMKPLRARTQIARHGLRHGFRDFEITLLASTWTVPMKPVPITAAHCEAITARGGDAFREYMLPHAALRLKQGFGRLIRTGADRGVVVIADPRVVTKSYGRQLITGLPPARRIVGRWSELTPTIRAFYNSTLNP